MLHLIQPSVSFRVAPLIHSTRRTSSSVPGWWERRARSDQAPEPAGGKWRLGHWLGAPVGALLLGLFSLGLPLPGQSQIYKWVDDEGRVHFSDRRYAREGFQPLEQPEAQASEDGWRFTFAPQADAVLNSNRNTNQGKTRYLSAGQWTTGGTTYRVASVMRFDISPLLSHIHSAAPGKRVERAELTLYANTEDKPYGQGVSNQEAPGHSTLQGSNAFYLKPSHNNWEENQVTWKKYYDASHYTPSTIRDLPTLTAPSSGNNHQRDYQLDVTELVSALVRTNTREFTLELALQRRSTMAQVTFFSREARNDKEPTLVIELERPTPTSH